MNSSTTSNSTYSQSYKTGSDSSSSGFISLPGIPSGRRKVFRNEPVVSNTKYSFSSCTKRRILKHVADNEDNINNYLVRENKTQEDDPKKRFIFNAEFHVCLHTNKNIKVVKDLGKQASDVVDVEGSKHSFSNANDAACFYQDSTTERRRRKEEKLRVFNDTVKQRIKEKSKSTLIEKEAAAARIKYEKERKKELYRKMCNYGKQANNLNMKIASGGTTPRLNSTNGNISPNSSKISSGSVSNTPRTPRTPRADARGQAFSLVDLDLQDQSHEECEGHDEQFVNFKSPTQSNSSESTSVTTEDSYTNESDNGNPKKTVNAFNLFARQNLANVVPSTSSEVYAHFEKGISKEDNNIIVQAPCFTVYLDDPIHTFTLNKPNYIPLNTSKASDSEIMSFKSSDTYQSAVHSNARSGSNKEQKKKEYREEKRYLKQLNKQFLETVKNMSIELPSLCHCDIETMDVNAQHSNNCYYFQNKNDYARDLSSLFHSYNL